MPESKDDIEQHDSHRHRGRSFAGISHSSWMQLPLVLVLIGVAYAAGGFKSSVESASLVSQQQVNAITASHNALASKFEAEVKDLRDKIDAIANNALQPKDVELAVRQVLSPEVARLWERVGAIDERTKSRSDPPPK